MSYCELCGKRHSIKECLLLGSEKKNFQSVEQFKFGTISACQTMPNWICMDEPKKKVITLKKIDKLMMFGPILGPLSSTPPKNATFPLCIQISDIRLWIDQSYKSNFNWLNLVPVSPEHHNLVACQVDENIYYVAVKDIKVSKELSVWYAPYYKTKLPPEVMEQTLCLITKNEKENDEVTNLSAENESLAVSVAYRNELQSSSVFTNALSFVNEVPILDNIYITNSSIDSSHFQSLSNKPITPISLTSTVRSNPPIILFASSFQSFNLEPICSSLSFVSSKLELGNQNGQILRLPDQDFGFTNHERLNAASDLVMIGAMKRKDENTQNIQEKEVFYREPRLENLQSITINNKELSFTYKLDKKNLIDVDKEKTVVEVNYKNHLIKDSLENSVNDYKSLSDNNSIKNSMNKIIIQTKNKPVEQRKKFNSFSENNCSNDIHMSETEEMSDAALEYDAITLNVSENQCKSSYVPISQVLKKLSLKKIASVEGIKTKEIVQFTEGCNAAIQPWICNQCEKNDFTSKLSFISHLKDHLTACIRRKYICQLCGLPFKMLDDLNKHFRTHADLSCSNNDDLVQKDERDWEERKVLTKGENQENRNRGWKNNFICQICLKKFNNAKYLLKHLSKHSGEFVCSLCRKEFARKENFKSHLCVERTENPWQCQTCKKRFTNSRSFKLHSLEHDEKVKCGSCSQIFLSEINLQSHQGHCRKEISSTEMLRFSCHICSRSFTSLVYLEDHVKFCKQLEDVNKSGEVTCDQCGSVCRNPVELRSHIEQHTYPYLCLHCLQRFRSRGTYERHICGMNYTCDLCNISVRSMQDLFRHITLHGPSPSCCQRCRLPFYQNESLKMHHCQLKLEEKKDEENKKKVGCYFCPSFFVSEHNLKKHLASLHDIPVHQKFICGKCGKNFHRSDLLKNHESVHLGPSFECLECPKKFRSKKSFAIHTAVHKGDFRFSCKICSKGFTQKKYLLRHEMNHKQPLVPNGSKASKGSIMQNDVLGIEAPDASEKMDQCS